LSLKRDGHTHTHYCLHGSGEHVEKFVLRAIEMKFQVYSFTEHLPLPDSFLNEFHYPDEVKEAFGFLNDDLDGYFKEMLALKEKYKDQIELLIGLEIDYLADEHEYLRAILKDYGSFLEDGLLSVHIIEGLGGWRCIDLSPEDFQIGLIDYYGSYEKAQLAYYQTVKEALQADLGPSKPKRISHLTLCNKFQHYFGQAGIVSEKLKATILDLLVYMRDHGYSIDANMSGLHREYCLEPYPAPWIIGLAKKLGIPLIYGSDAHQVKNVGRSYEHYLELIS
jgi:histidinol-phosphatase (PHP family)